MTVCHRENTFSQLSVRMCVLMNFMLMCGHGVITQD